MCLQNYLVYSMYQDPFNDFDFVLVTLGWIDVAISVANVKVLRVVRLIRIARVLR